MAGVGEDGGRQQLEAFLAAPTCTPKVEPSEPGTVYDDTQYDLCVTWRVRGDAMIETCQPIVAAPTYFGVARGAAETVIEEVAADAAELVLREFRGYTEPRPTQGRTQYKCGSGLGCKYAQGAIWWSSTDYTNGGQAKTYNYLDDYRFKGSTAGSDPCLYYDQATGEYVYGPPYDSPNTAGNETASPNNIKEWRVQRGTTARVLALGTRDNIHNTGSNPGDSRINCYVEDPYSTEAHSGDAGSSNPLEIRMSENFYYDAPQEGEVDTVVITWSLNGSPY
jgi:hypothetical protein